MASRLPQVRRRLTNLDADALLLTALPNIRWACGFTGSNGLLIVGPNDAHFVTDGRYTDQAQAEVEGATVHVVENGIYKGLSESELLSDFTSVAFQADSMTVARRDALVEQHESVEWIPETNLLSEPVASKDAAEIEYIRAAQSITEAVFDEIVDLIAPGMTEREVAAEIVYRHLKHGAEAMSFDPIVASGPNAARPHARPTDRSLRDGELVVLDMGCISDGYASDMTRTVALGTPGAEARDGYTAVLQAQTAALNAAHAGMTGKELDAVARSVLEDAGLEEFFTHGLGHGIGLQVHEWPRVSHSSDADLPEGACVTIEPGVYVPERNYGVRIEDIVVLRPDGCENLTRTQKELLVL